MPAPAVGSTVVVCDLSRRRGVLCVPAVVCAYSADRRTAIVRSADSGRVYRVPVASLIK